MNINPHLQDELEKRLEDAERELSSLGADLAAAHKRLRRDAGGSTAEGQLATARKSEEAALAQVPCRRLQSRSTRLHALGEESVSAWLLRWHFLWRQYIAGRTLAHADLWLIDSLQPALFYA